MHGANHTKKHGSRGDRRDLGGSVADARSVARSTGNRGDRQILVKLPLEVPDAGLSQPHTILVANLLVQLNGHEFVRRTEMS
jgi:hypothetical protein